MRHRTLTLAFALIILLIISGTALAADGARTAAALDRQLAAVDERMEANWPVVCATEVVNAGTHLYGTINCYSLDGQLLP